MITPGYLRLHRFESATATIPTPPPLPLLPFASRRPIYGLEDLGFVGRGEAGAYIEDGHTSPGGKLPMNTNGGGLSYTPTGMYGMFAMLESVRQVRGEVAHQVPDVQVSFCQGVGGIFMAAASLIFTNQPP